MSEQPSPEIDPSIAEYYHQAPEEHRLEQGPFVLEELRTRELIERHARQPPATVLDVGGAAGAYALWLADAGYTVHLVDPAPTFDPLRNNARFRKLVEGAGPTSPLVVLRPAAGDVWTEGESYTIRWRAAGTARVNVGLALGGKDKGHAALDLPASTDSLRWRVPSGFVSGFGLQRSDDARVRVEDARDPTRFAESPAFTIVAPGQ